MALMPITESYLGGSADRGNLVEEQELTSTGNLVNVQEITSTGSGWRSLTSTPFSRRKTR